MEESNEKEKHKEKRHDCEDHDSDFEIDEIDKIKEEFNEDFAVVVRE